MATFSVTDRQTYKRCRRKWDFSSNARQNLTKIGPGHTALELGGLIHRALAGWLLEPKTNLKLHFLNETNKRIEEIKEAYLRTVGAEISEEELGIVYDFVTLGSAMCENYQEVHKSPIPSNMRFAAAEQEIVIPIPGTEHYCEKCVSYNRQYNLINIMTDEWVNSSNKDCTDCGGTGTVYHYLSMTLDGLLQDTEDRLYVLERKTYDQRPKMIDLDMADQFTGYTWGVSQIADAIGLNGAKVVGIAYDGLWKRAKPPRAVKGKQLILEDLFIRRIIPKTLEQINEWGRLLTLEINEMANDPPIYTNIPWNGCWDCTFIDPCNMMMRGEDPSGLIKQQYTQREVIRIQGIRVDDEED